MSIWKRGNYMAYNLAESRDVMMISFWTRSLRCIPPDKTGMPYAQSHRLVLPRRPVICHGRRVTALSQAIYTATSEFSYNGVSDGYADFLRYRTRMGCRLIRCKPLDLPQSHVSLIQTLRKHVTIEANALVFRSMMQQGNNGGR